jgi:hypothetical protein
MIEKNLRQTAATMPETTGVNGFPRLESSCKALEVRPVEIVVEFIMIA